MRRVNLTNDIKPLSEFRANAAYFINQVKETKRPLILTQHGVSSAVVIDAAEYQALMDKLELLQEIQTAEQQLANGNYLSDGELKERLDKRYNK